MSNSSEVDINVLISLYNQKLSLLTNQNILLEAKVQSLTKDFEEEKNVLLTRLLELEKQTKNSSKLKNNQKFDEEYVNAEVKE